MTATPDTLHATPATSRHRALADVPTEYGDNAPTLQVPYFLRPEWKAQQAAIRAKDHGYSGMSRDPIEAIWNAVLLAFIVYLTFQFGVWFGTSREHWRQYGDAVLAPLVPDGHGNYQGGTP